MRFIVVVIANEKKEEEKSAEFRWFWVCVENFQKKLAEKKNFFFVNVYKNIQC